MIPEDSCVLLERGDVSTSVPAAPVMLSRDVSGQYLLKVLVTGNIHN